jgi:hypothetical protein
MADIAHIKMQVGGKYFTAVLFSHLPVRTGSHSPRTLSTLGALLSLGLHLFVLNISALAPRL